MTSLFSIRRIGDPVLAKAAKPVEHFDAALQELLRQMCIVMHAAGGVGLAAPQVGVSKQLFIIVYNNTDIAVANPTLTFGGAISASTEGCLSIPSQRFEIDRHDEVLIEGTDPLTGRTCRHELTGFAATIAQHEYDHLNGVLIADRHLARVRPR